MDAWTAGDAYEPYIGRWSALVARQFVPWLDPSPGWDWLDVGCGTGALTAAVAVLAAPGRVLGVDPSDGYLAHARQRVTGANVSFQTADGRTLPAADAAFDAAISGLVLNFIPEPAHALAEMRRVVRPGGLVAAYVWDYAGEMQLIHRFWEVAAVLDPAALALDEGRRFPICNPSSLRALFEQCELGVVDTRAIDIATRFKDFDDYWQPFLGGQGPAPGYVAALSESNRGELAHRLRTSLPVAGDGSINLIARAWAIKATR